MGKHQELPKGLRLHEDFITREAEAALVAQFEGAEKEVNEGHYDGFTFMDPEAFDGIFEPTVEALFVRMRKFNVFPAGIGKQIILGCTMIGYEVDGFIKPHVDSSALSGDVVCVLSMGSSAVIHLYRNGSARECQLLVPPRSLYVMHGEARFDWRHAIHPGPWVLDGRTIPRTRRYAMVFYEPGPMYDGELLYY